MPVARIAEVNAAKDAIFSIIGIFCSFPSFGFTDTIDITVKFIRVGNLIFLMMYREKLGKMGGEQTRLFRKNYKDYLVKSAHVWVWALFLLLPSLSAQERGALPTGEVHCESAAPTSLLHYRKGMYIFDMGVLARTYYSNDQRLQWTGNEETMGAEGILTPVLLISQRDRMGGVWSAHGEFYLQETLNENAYINVRGDRAVPKGYEKERQSYRANFNHAAFEISQLNIRYRNPGFEFRAGKMVSPFGNCVVPVMTNSRWDAPFIRTESMLWRDSGLLFRWTPSIFDICFAVTNGCEGLDTNSMKAFTGRLGLNFPNARLGISAVFHDGEGSEEQKQYRQHVGTDAVFRFGNWVLSSEIIYDQYGMHREYDPADIFWKKSIYYRQINKEDKKPISGWGGYVDLTYNYQPWFFSLNYGEFHPEQLKVPDAADPVRGEYAHYYTNHNIVNRRFMVKSGWNFTKNIQWYGVFIVENGGYIAQSGRPRRGYAYMTGVKMAF